MENKIPIYEDFLTSKIRAINPEWDYGKTHDEVFKQLWMFFDAPVVYKMLKEWHLEFAKLHVKAAKCEICHQMDLQLNNSQEAQEIVENSYPEENIK